MRTEGKARERRTGVGKRAEVSCCINFSFRGKMCLPREGTVCPGKANQESGFPPPISSPALSARFHRGTGHAHTNIRTHMHNDHEGAKQTTVVYLPDGAGHVKRLKVKMSEHAETHTLRRDLEPHKMALFDSG